MPDLTLEIATPERLLLREQVTEAEVPGIEGYLGILPGHAALISELAPGTLRYVAGGKTVFLAVLGGFVEVRDDKVRVLADAAFRKEEIDVEKARTDLKNAQDLPETLRAQALIDTATR
jgi:F-type H+-transporting ATPase subunit epsilon